MQALLSHPQHPLLRYGGRTNFLDAARRTKRVLLERSCPHSCVPTGVVYRLHFILSQGGFLICPVT